MANQSIKIKVTTTGGEKLAAVMKRIGVGGIRKIEVGVDPDARYPDGTPVKNVALYNEFGTANIPSRPFMRSAFPEMKRITRKEAKKADRVHLVMPAVVAKRAAKTLRDEVQKSIEKWSYPPNAPATIILKGRNDPLVDTRLMVDSIEAWVEGKKV